MWWGVLTNFHVLITVGGVESKNFWTSLYIFGCLLEPSTQIWHFFGLFYWNSNF
jgi:hypothetical protein